MRRLTISIILIFGCVLVQAQTRRLTEVELWLKAGGKLNLTERLKFSFEEQIRFDGDISVLKNFHAEFDFRYTVTEQFDIHAVARYITRNDNRGTIQGFEDRFRFQLGGSYSHKAGQWRFKHRLLYQNRNDINRTRDQGDVHVQFLRLRTNIEYKIKEWNYDPQFRVEYFKTLNDRALGAVNQARIGIGTEREYEGIGEFGFFFLMDFTDFNNIMFVDQIFFLKYTFKF